MEKSEVQCQLELLLFLFPLAELHLRCLESLTVHGVM